MNIDIRHADIVTAVRVSLEIPELVDPHPAQEYYQRLAGKMSLILVAYVDNNEAGFKVGYDKFGDGSFYSWMGGVVPAYRKNHIAKSLADTQETWALANGFNSIVFKTRNRHKAMLLFAISNGFSVMSVEEKPDVDDYRILLKKPLYLVSSKNLV